MRNAESGDGSASPTPTPADAPWMQAALSAVRPEGTVTSVEPIEAGVRRSTLAVRFADADPIVVRHGSDRTAVETEVALLSAVVAETTVPVAAPLGWELSEDGSGGLDDSNGPSDADRDRATAWRDWLVGQGRESLDRLPSEFDDVAAAARRRLDAWTVEDAPTPCGVRSGPGTPGCARCRQSMTFTGSSPLRRPRWTLTGS